MLTESPLETALASCDDESLRVFGVACAHRISSVVRVLTPPERRAPYERALDMAWTSVVTGMTRRQAGELTREVRRLCGRQADDPYAADYHRCVSIFAPVKALEACASATVENATACAEHVLTEPIYLIHLVTPVKPRVIDPRHPPPPTSEELEQQALLLRYAESSTPAQSRVAADADALRLVPTIVRAAKVHQWQVWAGAA